MVPGLLVVMPTSLAFAWGLSWAAGGYPKCGEGTYFLADLSWVGEGFLLGLIVGIVTPIILAARGSFLLAIPVLVAVPVLLAVAVGMLLAGDAGATIAPPLVGCTAYFTHDDGEVIALGLVLSGAPTILITGFVIAIRAHFRPAPAPKQRDTDPSTKTDQEEAVLPRCSEPGDRTGTGTVPGGDAGRTCPGAVRHLPR